MFTSFSIAFITFRSKIFLISLNFFFYVANIILLSTRKMSLVTEDCLRSQTLIISYIVLILKLFTIYKRVKRLLLSRSIILNSLSCHLCSLNICVSVSGLVICSILLLSYHLHLLFSLLLFFLHSSSFLSLPFHPLNIF